MDFIGTPIAERHLPSDDDWEETVYTVRPEKWFRGHLDGLITMKTANDSGRFDLVKGKRDLIFMQTDPNGAYFADGCGHTGVASKSVRVLAALRSLPHFGTSYLYGGCINGDCAGVSVYISGVTGTLKVGLDASGRFLVRVTPGSYKVRMVGAGRAWAPYELSYHDPDHVGVPDGGSAGVSFMAGP